YDMVLISNLVIVYLHIYSVCSTRTDPLMNYKAIVSYAWIKVDNSALFLQIIAQILAHNYTASLLDFLSEGNNPFLQSSPAKTNQKNECEKVILRIITSIRIKK